MFIEPQEVVEANNRIRELEGEERREVIRILREFTENLRPMVPQLLQSYEMLADVEFVENSGKKPSILPDSSEAACFILSSHLSVVLSQSQVF